jgi:hypothetical protein
LTCRSNNPSAKTVRWSARYVVFLLLAGVAEAQSPPSHYQPFAALADLMSGILFPNSNVIFDVTVPKKAPKTDADWIAVQTSAAALVCPTCPEAAPPAR